MNPEVLTPTIAIIGGGASGCLVAVQLLRQAERPLRVLLIERMSDIGRGLAYGTANREHLLNVPAAKMGAFPDDIGHFFKWLKEQGDQAGYPSDVSAGDFLPRWIFGDYLQAVLADAVANARAGVRFETLKAEVVDIEESDGTVRLRCGDGQSIAVNQVVLAVGNLPGEYPIRRSLPIYHSQSYVHVPWRQGVLAGIPADSDILLVGAGLTAIDLVLELRARGHRGKIHALSRRGLRPLQHVAGAGAYPSFFDDQALPATMRELMRTVRAEVAKAAEAGIDWRTVLDAIRPHSHLIWQKLSWEERARFMRHVRPFWEVHRHRIAPAVAEKIDALREAGQLHFYAGRLTKLVEQNGRVLAEFRRRGTTEVKQLTVAKVINCTGPRSDYSKYQHPLLINLLARGLIDHDPLALGINTENEGAVLRYRTFGDGPVGWLYTIGAPLKGVRWESTAIPEIRTQAAVVARSLLQQSLALV
jgi:uncharacterized NAD(P)/FAD-binding protein YdhS